MQAKRCGALRVHAVRIVQINAELVGPKVFDTVLVTRCVPSNRRGLGNATIWRGPCGIS